MDSHAEDMSKAGTGGTAYQLQPGSFCRTGLIHFQLVDNKLSLGVVCIAVLEKVPGFLLGFVTWKSSPDEIGTFSLIQLDCLFLHFSLLEAFNFIYHSTIY